MQLQLNIVLYLETLRYMYLEPPPWDTFIDYKFINSFKQPSYYDSRKKGTAYPLICLVTCQNYFAVNLLL